MTSHTNTSLSQGTQLGSVLGSCGAVKELTRTKTGSSHSFPYHATERTLSVCVGVGMWQGWGKQGSQNSVFRLRRCPNLGTFAFTFQRMVLCNWPLDTTAGTHGEKGCAAQVSLRQGHPSFHSAGARTDCVNRQTLARYRKLGDVGKNLEGNTPTICRQLL